MTGAFVEGDLALLIDPKDRHYLVKLGTGRAFHSHLGAVPHEAIIGQEGGARVYTQSGHEITVLRPTLADYTLKMKRQAQVIYPKDIGPILVHGDIFPGAQVLEAGVGAGALSIALLRAVGPMGHLTTYEIREDLATVALKNIREFNADTANFTLKIGDIYQGIEERGFDRVVLDVPEPWMAINTVGESLGMGGIFLSYSPTVLQIHHLHQSLTDDPRFDFIEAFEVLHRGWHLAATSARPNHRMVGHTGFVLRALRCQPRTRARPAELVAAAKRELEKEHDAEADADRVEDSSSETPQNDSSPGSDKGSEEGPHPARGRADLSRVQARLLETKQDPSPAVSNASGPRAGSPLSRSVGDPSSLGQNRPQDDWTSPQDGRIGQGT